MEDRKDNKGHLPDIRGFPGEPVVGIICISSDKVNKKKNYTVYSDVGTIVLLLENYVNLYLFI